MPPPRRPWFRLYVEAVSSDRKLRRLPIVARWMWIAVLAAARQSPVPGRLLVAEGQPFDDHDLADFAAVTIRDVRTGMRALIDGGLVEIGEAGEWVVPRWAERQFESDEVTKRTAKHRSNGTTMERSNVVPGNGDGTPPETEAETETDPSTSASASTPSTRPAPDGTTRAKQATLTLARRAIDERAAAGEDIRSPAAVARLHAEKDLWPTIGDTLLAIAEQHPDANPTQLVSLHLEHRQAEHDEGATRAQAELDQTQARLADLHAVPVAPEVPPDVRAYLNRRRNTDGSDAA